MREQTFTLSHNNTFRPLGFCKDIISFYTVDKFVSIVVNVLTSPKLGWWYRWLWTRVSIPELFTKQMLPVFLFQQNVFSIVHCVNKHFEIQLGLSWNYLTRNLCVVVEMMFVKCMTSEMACFLSHNIAPIKHPCHTNIVTSTPWISKCRLGPQTTH
jgi:hypothetical protein